MLKASQALLDLLAGLGESARFESVGGVIAILPGLNVKSIGPIGSPVSPADARRMIDKASQAPYGRGEATIVDTKVRRVWQLDPSQFELRNTAWNGVIAGIAETVRKDLGIRTNATAEIYKLLVYEKGGFFKPHRDTEKIPGMFATLVVCLPSRHEGGALILEHDGQTKQIEFGGKDSEFQSRYAAFYADCRHGVKPVKSGFRVCLVYNLASSSSKQPAAPHYADAVAKAADLLRRLFAQPDALAKVAIPFKHQYSEAGFDPAELKGADRARADVLIRAARSLDFEANSALLSLLQEGIPDYSTMDFDDSYGRGGSRWSGYDDDEDEEDESDEGDFDEIFDEELKLDHWRDSEGREQPFGPLYFEDREVLGIEQKDGWSVKQSIQEATGNEGASMERWYRQAVMAIWPRERHFETLAVGGGCSAAMPSLEKLAAQSKTKEELAFCGTAAAAVIANWRGDHSDAPAPSHLTGPMLRVLERVGDAELAIRFLQDGFSKSFSGTEGGELHRLCEAIGWTALLPSIKAFLSHHSPKDHRTKLLPIVSIIERLCCDPPAMSKDRRTACAAIAEELIAVVETWDKSQPRHSRFAAIPEFDDFPDGDEREIAIHHRGDERTGVIASVVRMLSAIDAKKLLTRFVDYALVSPKRYGLREAVIPDVKSLYSQPIANASGRNAAERLLQHCLDQLREATAKAPEPPSNWTRKASLGCRCKDCEALSRFLRDPAERIGRFPLAKQRRHHLHQQIEAHGCDCTHVTEHRGSPHTLVCTKTQATYDRLRKRFEDDQETLAELEKLAKPRRASTRRGKTS